MLRFGILGAGRIGKVHARTIAASGKAKVAYLADAMLEEESTGVLTATITSPKQMMRMREFDAEGKLQKAQ